MELTKEVSMLMSILGSAHIVILLLMTMKIQSHLKFDLLASPAEIISTLLLITRKCMNTNALIANTTLTKVEIV